MPKPVSRTQSRISPPATDEPMAIVSCPTVCCTALWTRFMTASVRRWRSTNASASAAPSSSHVRGAIAAALAINSLVNGSMSIHVGRRKSGCWASARSWRSSTMRAIRSSSSTTSAIVASRSSGSSLRQLEVAADDRERVAQLVAGVVDELALAAHHGLEPVEHRVEASRHLGGLVTPARADPPGQVGLGDRAGGIGQLLHRPQDPPSQEVGRDRADEEDAERCQQTIGLKLLDDDELAGRAGWRRRTSRPRRRAGRAPRW